MPKKNSNILKYNQGKKCLRMPFIIYADTKSLLEKIFSCGENPKKLSAINITQHVSCGCSLFTHSSFDGIKNKHIFTEVMIA